MSVKAVFINYSYSADYSSSFTQTFYRFVGNIRPGTGHVRGLWRLRRRQENPAARKQANLQRSDHRSLLFIAHYFFCSVMRLMKRLIIAQLGRGTDSISVKRHQYHVLTASRMS